MATKAYKANAATGCLQTGMVEPKLRMPKASTYQVSYIGFASE
jgi:hypothetical protein